MTKGSGNTCVSKHDISYRLYTLGQLCLWQCFTKAIRMYIKTLDLGLVLHDKKVCYTLSRLLVLLWLGALYGEDKSSFAAMCSAGTINKCNF